MNSVSTQASPTVENASGLLDYISPTRLNTWLSCPLRFQLRYEEGIKEPTSLNLFLGQRVHDALAYFYRHQQDGRHVTANELGEHIRATWGEAVADEQMNFDSVEEESALTQRAIGLVQTYLDQRDNEDGFPLAVETPLECPLVDPITGDDLGISLFGIVDLVLDAPGGDVVVDFKTTAKSSAPLEISHEIQLSCYAYAFRRVYGETEQELQIRSLIKTKTPKIEIHRYPARTDAHFRRLFAVIRAYLDDVDSGRYVYRPSWTCSMCDFRETHCRRWQG